MDFLKLGGRKVLVFGVANRKSVAWRTAEVLEAAGATVLYVVRSESRRESMAKLLAGREVFVCDVERQAEIDALADAVTASLGPGEKLAAVLHSLAFADYSAGWLPFHETPRRAFLQAVDISCYSLIAVANALRESIDPQTGSVVTVSISTTRMAAENYGYMAP
ncbi:MAG: SDR family oxidoreductase, partial [Planctomycetota bacterium]